MFRVGVAIWAQFNGPTRSARKMGQVGLTFWGLDLFGPMKKVQKYIGPKWVGLIRFCFLFF